MVFPPAARERKRLRYKCDKISFCAEGKGLLHWRITNSIYGLFLYRLGYRICAAFDESGKGANLCGNLRVWFQIGYNFGAQSIYLVLIKKCGTGYRKNDNCYRQRAGKEGDFVKKLACFSHVQRGFMQKMHSAQAEKTKNFGLQMVKFTKSFGGKWAISMESLLGIDEASKIYYIINRQNTQRCVPKIFPDEVRSVRREEKERYML